MVEIDRLAEHLQRPIVESGLPQGVSQGREHARIVGRDLGGAAAGVQGSLVVLAQAQNDAQGRMRGGGFGTQGDRAARRLQGRGQAITGGQGQGQGGRRGGIVWRHRHGLLRFIQGRGQPLGRLFEPRRVEVERNARKADVRVGPIRPQSESLAKQALGLGLVLGSRPRHVLVSALYVGIGIQSGIVAGPRQSTARRNDEAGNQRPDDEGGAGPGAV